jgi:hypothetical protein
LAVLVSRKLALKRLTASDLTLFKWHFLNRPAGNQKAINMDQRVLVHALYPSLPEAVESLPDPRVLINLSILGPGLAGPHPLARKILKQQKNWRLDGEFIENPNDAPERFNGLREGDFALLEFRGAPLPNVVRMALISRNHAEDTGLHAEFESRFGATSMSTLDDATLDQIVDTAAPPVGHPIFDLVDTEVLEDVALGGTESIEKLLKRRKGRGLSPEDLKNSKEVAERNGRLGEEILNEHFEVLRTQGTLGGFEWVSASNAISPYDFHLTTGAGPIERLLDAKATSGSFSNPIHLSLAELIRSQQGDFPYDIYRLYEVREASAKLRVARNVGPALRPILDAVAKLPARVTVDGFCIPTDLLSFDAEVVIILSDEDAE